MRMRLLQAGGLLYCTLAYGANLQNSDLKLETTISVPNWAVGRASTDLFGFNPVTRTMYLADRTNHAVTVIDTASKRVIGQIPLSATTAVNQPLVAIDLQQLVVSDGVQSVLVWDLRAPMTSAPTVYTMPSVSLSPERAFSAVGRFSVKVAMPSDFSISSTGSDMADFLREDRWVGWRPERT